MAQQSELAAAAAVEARREYEKGEVWTFPPAVMNKLCQFIFGQLPMKHHHFREGL